MSNGLSKIDDAVFDNPDAIKKMDAELEHAIKTNADLRWAVGHGKYVFQVDRSSDFLRKTRDYILKDVIKNIDCTMLVVDSEEESQMKGQARKLYDALTCQKDFLLFTKAEGAGPHCQVGGYALSNEKIFNWLDEQLSTRNRW